MALQSVRVYRARDPNDKKSLVYQDDDGTISFCTDIYTAVGRVKGRLENLEEQGKRINFDITFAPSADITCLAPDLFMYTFPLSKNDQMEFWRLFCQKDE